MNFSSSLRIASTFLWVGFVCAISFMEAWLKFTAPGVSLTVGLSIGKIVFSALNKVEIALGVTILITCLSGNRKELLSNGLLIFCLVILIVQTLYLLPELSARIDIYQSGQTPQPSSLHVVYVVLEGLKVVTLLYFGFWLLKRVKHSSEEMPSAIGS
jgi:hypothetical protein